MNPRVVTVAKYLVGLIIVTSIIVGVEYAMLRYLGVINTVVYTLAFLIGVGILPLVALLFGQYTPSAVAKLNDIMGALAYGRTILVQREDKWELAPATRTRVYIDDTWHHIEGGLENWTMYAWRPFGILRYKTEDTLVGARSDTYAERARGEGDDFSFAADGGTGVHRGGVKRASPPGVSGTDGWWLVDLTRLYARGLRKFGDIDLIETAEEIAARSHAATNRLGQWEGIVAFVVTLVLGVLTGMVLFGNIA